MNPVKTRGVVSRKSKPSSEKQFCSYVHRVCLQNRLDGYEYCIRHILEDKNAPFRQCSFVHQQSGKRCTNAAPKSDRRESILCPWHAKKMNLNKLKLLRTQKTAETLPSLFGKLQHYCSGPCHSRDPQLLSSQQISTGDASDTGNCSDSGSELDTPPVDDTWKGTAESDGESVDSDYDDPLKHAGVYTADEVVRITCDKLLRLQSLYIDQFKRLQHVLKERKRAYLKAVKQEKETLGSVQSSQKKTFEENIQYQKLKALHRYHRYYGKEAILRYKAKLKRESAAEEFPTTSSSLLPHCVFQEKGVKCRKNALPYSRYCLKHILSDRQQVLYKHCSAAPESCLNPVVPIREKEGCLLHVQFDKSLAELEKHLPLKPQPVKPAAGSSDVEGLSQESEHFQFMDDITSLGLDVVQPGSLFGLNQFGDLGESTDSALSGEGPEELLQPMALNATDILEENQKSLDRVEK